jgi:hypothetical protein
VQVVWRSNSSVVDCISMIQTEMFGAERSRERKDNMEEDVT